MLRLLKSVSTAVALGGLLVSSPALAQNGLGSRLDAKEQQLTQDEQNCREVNLAEYVQLLQEASENWTRAQKAKKKGVPVDETQVNADLAKAMQLFARAQAAHVRRCMLQAQQVQPKTTGAIPGGSTPAGGGQCAATPPPTPAAASDGPRIPTQEEVSHLGQLMDDAGSLGHASEADYVLRELDEMGAKLSKTIMDAKKVGQFSNIDIKEAEKRLRQIDAYRLAGEKFRIPCPPPEPKKPTQTSMNLPPWARDMLAAHNAARAAVGSPPLEWNPVLQEHATERAREIAQARQLVHAPREGRGTERENILSAPVGYSPTRMIQVWTDESRHFVPGIFPNVSDTGNWADVAHYTQVVSYLSTDIGCGYAEGGGFNWLVCRYDPGGNKDGKPVIQPRPIGGDYGTEHQTAIADNSGVAPETSTTTTATPRPSPPPTATDEAPGGNEDNHPLVGYGAEAFIRHSAAVDCGNQAAADTELAKLRYAIAELKKRLKAAKKAGNFSTVKPDDVQRQINLLESFLRAAEQRKPKGACPAPPPAPPPPP